MAATLNFDLDSSKYKNDARNGLSMPNEVGKVVITGFYVHCFLSYNFNMAAGGHLEFWYSDLPKYKMGFPCHI